MIIKEEPNDMAILEIEVDSLIHKLERAESEEEKERIKARLDAIYKVLGHK